MSAALFTETVGLRSRQVVGTDDLNNDILDWVEEPSPAWVEIGVGTEQTDQRETSDATSTVYLPLVTPLELTAVSEVRWNGKLWQVVGEPGLQPGGFSVEGYQKLGIKRVVG